MKNDVNKCPACGALRPALVAQCPECGYDFHHTTCKMVEELNIRFENISEKSSLSYKVELQQIEVIRSFAVPQIKEEILDLLIYIQPKATRRNSKITEEWRLRQKEVIQRAKMAFANDKKVLAQVQEYEEHLKKIEKQYLRQWWQKRGLISKIVIVVAVLFFTLLIIPAKDVSPEAYAVRFAEAVEEGQYSKALKYLDKSPEMGKLIADQYLSLIDALVAENRFVEAENLYNKRTQFVSSKDNAAHLSQTSSLFIQHYLDQMYYDMAEKFVVDAKGSAMILKELINSGDVVVAMRYFRKNANKFLIYSSEERKRVLTVDDEIIKSFVQENNLLR